ncbi:MAG: hypothetical protein Q4E04_02970 [Slackia piriformis]|nr:hypothetical protein [Slackia piriformis]
MKNYDAIISTYGNAVSIGAGGLLATMSAAKAAKTKEGEARCLIFA